MKKQRREEIGKILEQYYFVLGILANFEKFMDRLVIESGQDSPEGKAAAEKFKAGRVFRDLLEDFSGALWRRAMKMRLDDGR